MSLAATRRRREEEPEREDTSLTCRARGCPMRWSVSVNMACSYHAWAPTREWPSITERLQQHGPWRLQTPPGTTPTVRDMKSRLKGHLPPTIPETFA